MPKGQTPKGQMNAQGIKRHKRVFSLVEIYITCILFSCLSSATNGTLWHSWYPRMAVMIRRVGTSYSQKGKILTGLNVWKGEIGFVANGIEDE